jgi:hypothetical protein
LLGVALAVVYRRHIGPQDAIVAPPGRYYTQQLGARVWNVKLSRQQKSSEPASPTKL